MCLSLNLQMKPIPRYQVDRYTPSDWPRVATLLGAWPFKPFTRHSNWAADKLTALCLARAAVTLEGTHTDAWLVRSDDDARGMASLTELPWDSQQLVMSAARLDFLVARGSYDEQYQIKKALLATAVEHARQRDIQHVSARLDASDLSGLHLLESSGFITVDAILTFALDLSSASCQLGPHRISLRLATGADSEALAELARTAFVYDRFHADPVISSARACELHAEWLRNCCAGAAADAVVLAEDEQGLLGFVTCKLQPDTRAHLGKLIGTIVLVATADRTRGRGVARAATLASLEWFRNHQADIVEVGTQLRNIPASCLYQSCGFRLAGSTVSLRKFF